MSPGAVFIAGMAAAWLVSRVAQAWSEFQADMKRAEWLRHTDQATVLGDGRETAVGHCGYWPAAVDELEQRRRRP